MEIDQLRLKRDRAKVEVELALETEREALQRLAQDPAGFDAWQQAKELAALAITELQSAQKTFQEALRGAQPHPCCDN
jgi:hypothetical protein